MKKNLDVCTMRMMTNSVSMPISIYNKDKIHQLQKLVLVFLVIITLGVEFFAMSSVLIDLKKINLFIIFLS